MKFRKKPVIIEAFKYDGDLKDRNGLFYVPFWAQEAYKKGIMYYGAETCDLPPCELYIETLEGRLCYPVCKRRALSVQARYF